ncbi:MAG: AEC family transporter [Thomasclavelia sp.]|jgi:predicted permease|nr:AEC family transporter [Thomasclavelia sp.]
MELSILLIKQIIGLFLIVVLGFVIVKMKVLSTFDSKTISTLVLYVVAPCTIINAFQIEFTKDTFNGLMLSFLAAGIVHIIFFVITPIFDKMFHFMNIEKATVMYSNSGNLVIPLVSAVLGPKWVLYCSGYMIIQTILLWTHCKALVCEENDFSFKKILLNINVISIFIGILLFVFKIQLPSMIATPVTNIGNMIGPLSMLVIGMVLANINFKNVFASKRTYLICFLRLVVYPLIVIGVFKLCNIQSLHPEGFKILLITVLAASAPAGSTVTQFAQLYDKHPGYASAMNVLSVIFCIITMPLMIMLYQML